MNMKSCEEEEEKDRKQGNKTSQSEADAGISSYKSFFQGLGNMLKYLPKFISICIYFSKPRNYLFCIRGKPSKHTCQNDSPS